MKITCLVGSAFSSNTRVAMDYTVDVLTNKNPDHEVTLIDLAEYDVEFSDGRNYLDYKGDTAEVTQQIMDSDALIIGTPIFQASIPGALKNVFDLLPVNAFRDKVVGMLAVAGSEKHFLVLEQQLKPILGYMKAQVVQSYVFVNEIDFRDEEIINDDVLFRIDHLADDTVTLLETYKEIREAKDAEYDF